MLRKGGRLMVGIVRLPMRDPQTFELLPTASRRQGPMADTFQTDLC